MHIELLWLIPVFAFGAFLFVVAFYAQRRAEVRAKERDLSKEVAMFNSGQQQKFSTAASADDRLKEMEKTINFVAETFVNQQRSVQDIHKESAVYTNEINDLKEKLRTMFKEYDIVLSENYALRAKVKQLMKAQERTAKERTGKERNGKEEDAGTPAFDSFLTGAAPAATHAPAMQFYDDTRLINLNINGDEVSESIGPAARQA